MPESSVVVRPEPPDSSWYSAASRLQAAGLRRAMALFDEAAAAVPIPRVPRPIVIADYGAGTGYNSVLPLCSAISVLRKRTQPEHSILVTHTDAPDNDFTALFRTLSHDPDSYLKRDDASFASAVGRSYYKQILPSNSVNLAWSAWALHWLARVPMPVSDHLLAAYTRDPAVRAAYARQAAFDWHEFVAFRGRELCPGGRMVVMTMGVDEDGQLGFGPLVAAISETLEELVARDVITADEYAGMSIPIVGRTAKDFESPFAPSGTFEKLSITGMDLFDGEDRFFKQYRSDGKADAFGAQWAAFVRAALSPTLAGQLTPNRPADAFSHALEAGVAARLAAAPAGVRIPLALVVIEKKQPRD
ncbi:class I SAM-dependent methyltransferase [Mycolicibacterium sediminis]|nr:class I SAM-dependent methyltransferase [Mycolicibacterium sediminis]